MITYINFFVLLPIFIPLISGCFGDGDHSFILVFFLSSSIIYLLCSLFFLVRPRLSYFFLFVCFGSSVIQFPFLLCLLSPPRLSSSSSTSVIRLPFPLCLLFFRLVCSLFIHCFGIRKSSSFLFLLCRLLPF